MNLYHLRYFVTLAQIEHYTRAAELLSITQPSLSHAIDSLEKELGVQLFEKSGRNVLLTRHGKAFYAEVSEILERLDASVQNLRRAGRGEGQIDIAFLWSLGVDFIPKVIRDFLDASEGKDIRFGLFSDQVMTVDILKGLKERRYDIGFCSRYEDEPLIEYVPVARQDLVVIVPPAHPLADRESVCLSDTLPYGQIIMKEKSGLRRIIDGLFDRIGAAPKVVCEVDEDQVAAGFVAAGFGLAVLPDSPVLYSLGVRVLPLTSPAWQRNFYMAALKDTYRPPAVEAFWNFVREKTRKELYYKQI